MKTGKEQGYDIVLCDTSGRKFVGEPFILLLNCLRNFVSLADSLHLMYIISGLHTNYSLMEELIACKKAVTKVMPGAPNVSSAVGHFYHIFIINFENLGLPIEQNISE